MKNTPKSTPPPGMDSVNSEFSSGRGTGLGRREFPTGTDIKPSETKDPTRAIKAGPSNYPTSGGTKFRTPPETLFKKDRI